MKASEGEEIRAREKLRTLRTILNSVEYDLEHPEPPGPATGQAVAHAANDLAMTLARLDAYRRAEAGVVEVQEQSAPRHPQPRPGVPGVLVEVQDPLPRRRRPRRAP